MAHSRLWEDIAGRQIAAAAAAILPPEMVAAAQERGRARELWIALEQVLVELENIAPNGECILDTIPRQLRSERFRLQ